jgi:hypothetical protein
LQLKVLDTQYNVLEAVDFEAPWQGKRGYRARLQCAPWRTPRTGLARYIVVPFGGVGQIAAVSLYMDSSGIFATHQGRQQGLAALSPCPGFPRLSWRAFGGRGPISCSHGNAFHYGSERAENLASVHEAAGSATATTLAKEDQESQLGTGSQPDGTWSASAATGIQPEAGGVSMDGEEDGDEDRKSVV